MMQIRYFSSAAAFDGAASQWLAPARGNNQILSVVKNSVRHGGDGGRGWLVASAGPRLALFQAPPHYLLLSLGDEQAAGYAADQLQEDLPGLSGPVPLADAFAAQWSAKTGCGIHLNFEMTYYTLDRLQPFTRPSGCLRRAVLEDFDRLVELAVAAAREMNLPPPEQNRADVETNLRRLLAERRQLVWAEGSVIRAIASYTEALPGAGARIRWVYTPPEFRGRGFGTAVTGALAEWLLEEGQAWVSLFADSANPTSNSIYARLGFRPELAFRVLRFETARD